MTDAAELFEGFKRFAIEVATDTDSFGQLDEWLSVVVHVREGTQVWSEEDTCLTRTEVETLAAWFESLGADSPPSECRFAEGSLKFNYANGQITVLLDLEFAPPDTMDTYSFEIPADWKQTSQFASALRGQLVSLDVPDDRPSLSFIPVGPGRR